MPHEERTDETKAVGLRIREERKRAGLSRQRFAELMGWVAKQIGRYEMGFKISDHRLAQVAKNLGIRFEYLKDGTGERFDVEAGSTQNELIRQMNSKELRGWLKRPSWPHPLNQDAMPDPLPVFQISRLDLEQLLHRAIVTAVRTALAEIKREDPPQTPRARKGGKVGRAAG
jgi:transcriptional regulator with XRE-family HTH domain